MISFIDIIFLLAGLSVLIKSSEFVINNSIKLSKLTGVSKAFIGFVFLAFAASLPELVVSVTSALRGEAALGISTLIGSNISIITRIFGIMALLATFHILEKNAMEIEKTLFVTTIIAAFSLVLGGTSVVLGVFSVALFYLFFRFMFKKSYVVKTKRKVASAQVTKSVVFILIGIILIIVSANFVTDSALALSTFLDITILGSVIVAFGTSLPELALSIAALRKHDLELAIGNVIGSLVTHLTIIFGISAILSPFVYTFNMKIGMVFLIFTNVIFYLLVRRKRFGKSEGLILMSLYALFLVVTVYLGV